MRTYGQYCPVARASELLAERWTLILVRNLLAGCTSFGELVRGAPGIPRALLAQRLTELERHGVLVKRHEGEARPRYALTDKGRALQPVVDALGAWGAEWLEVEPQHVSADYVLWATCQLVDVEMLPQAGLVVRADLADRPSRPVWLVLRRPRGEVCTAYLGWPEDLLLRTSSDTLVQWHLRRTTYRQAVADGHLRIDGSPPTVRAFLRALRPSPYVDVQDPAPPAT